jgi:hypothetical protein
VTGLVARAVAKERFCTDGELIFGLEAVRNVRTKVLEAMMSRCVSVSSKMRGESEDCSLFEHKIWGNFSSLCSMLLLRFSTVGATLSVAVIGQELVVEMAGEKLVSPNGRAKLDSMVP